MPGFFGGMGLGAAAGGGGGSFAGGGGGGGGLFGGGGGGAGGFLPALLEILKNVDVSYQGSGGGGFGFSGGGQDRERRALKEKLMGLLQGPQATGRRESPVVFVGGRDGAQEAETPMGSTGLMGSMGLGNNAPLGMGFNLNEPLGFLSRPLR